MTHTVNVHIDSKDRFHATEHATGHKSFVVVALNGPGGNHNLMFGKDDSEALDSLIAAAREAKAFLETGATP